MSDSVAPAAAGRPEETIAAYGPAGGWVAPDWLAMGRPRRCLRCWAPSGRAAMGSWTGRRVFGWPPWPRQLVRERRCRVKPEAEEARFSAEQEAQWCGGCGYRCLQCNRLATGRVRRPGCAGDIGRTTGRRPGRTGTAMPAAGGQALAVSTDMTDEAAVTERWPGVPSSGSVVSTSGSTTLVSTCSACWRQPHPRPSGGAGDQLLRLRPRGLARCCPCSANRATAC